MRRRDLLHASGAAALAGLAGCAGLLETRSGGEPPLVDPRPDAVYVPTHVEGMAMAGMQSDGGYRCALTYTYPHRFWTVTGQRRERIEVESDDSVHLMPVVWHAETGVVPPDRSIDLTVTQGGEAVTPPLSPWSMLSQPMGFHFGDNVALDGDGTYRVEVGVGAPSTRRTGALADAAGQLSFSFDLEFEQSALEEVMYRDIPDDEEGTAGAVDPMDGMDALPSTQAPAEADLPGTVRGKGTSGDARFVVATVADATPFGGGEDETYLAVSPRTPYNRYVLPAMSLSATLGRGTETVFDGDLRATIDPALGYHYGAAVSGVESGDDLTVTVDAPPQVARHEGYETAFLSMDDVSVAL